MLQLISITIHLALLFEVLFLFTCGQRYMKLQIMRNRRNFLIERVTYVVIGVFAVCNIVFSKTPEVSETLLIAAVTFLLLRKCFSANKHYRQTKAAGNARTHS